MATERPHRRLAAILAADVAGYCRLTGLDEEGTHTRLREHLQSLVEPKIAEHRGLVVKNTGDGLLAEFSSVVDTIRCALDIQRGMAERNLDVPEETRIEFRIGVNTGDIMIDRGDIFGDDVNIAVRLEGVAEPGGICVPRRVLEDIQGKLDVAFEDVGDHQLKNIARPVRIYRVLLDRSAPSGHHHIHAATATPHLSMVVLPFINLSVDHEQDYLVDGITEALTTDLSRIPESLVIARNTAFTYKGKSVDSKRIGRELGVRYIIEGSVQFDGNRLRVNVQLINAATGVHLWAERFDQNRGNVFEMQDEIVTHLARALDVELVFAEAKRAARSANPHSVDLTFRGWAAMNRGVSVENLTEAREFFGQALALDGTNVMALTGLADANSAMVVGYMTDDRFGRLAATEAAAMKALSLAPNEAKAHASLALLCLWTNRPFQAISEYERATALDRNLAFAYANTGIAKYVAGRPEETEDHIARAIRLSPRDAWMNAWCTAAGVAKLAMGRDEEAVMWLRRAIEANRTLPIAHYFLAAALALQGKTTEAEAAVTSGRALDPGFTIRRYRESPLSDNPTYLTQRQRISDGLHKAGVSEE